MDPRLGIGLNARRRLAAGSARTPFISFLECRTCRYAGPRRPDRRHRRGYHLRPCRRRARADGRGRRPGPRHVGGRACDGRDRRPADPLRGGGIQRRPGAADALRGPGGRQARLQGPGLAGAGGDPAERRLARPGGQRAGRADRRQGPAAAGRRSHAVSRLAAGRPYPPARGQAARHGCACDEHLPDLLPRPAHGHLRRLRRRQVGSAVDDRPQCRCRRLGDRADRRTRPGGPGIPPGGSRRGRPRTLRGGGRDLGRTGADAQAGRLPVAVDRRIFSRPGPAGHADDGFCHALRHGAARDRPVGRRTADRQGLYADGLLGTAAPTRARRPRLGRGRDHRHLHRAGRRRRSQRAGGRRGARYPGRPYRDGARHRRARPLSGHQCAEERLAHHAAVGGSGLLAGHPAGEARAFHLYRHGGTDPARRLSAGLVRRGRRGDPAAAGARGISQPAQGRGQRIG
eukprot:Opistho-1_new@15558